MEKRIQFQSGSLLLEGLWRPGPTGQAVVVAHPHPLYGGDMHNPVVATIADSFASKGYATLRFNFRGTGGSEGRYDDGPGERQDLAAALKWARQQSAAAACVAGYSFGGWVAAGAAVEGHLDGAPLYLVAPPVGFISFDALSAPPALTAVVAGTRDDIAPLPQVRALLARWQAEELLSVIADCDHFYSGCLPRLAEALASRIPPAKATADPAAAP
ncbi:MAG: CocE/NonD family hydrolase [Desulfosarcinaceae bacterium]|nr:CocE/NonD family hydrolase [Desulfosarcinaceae bacterium]